MIKNKIKGIIFDFDGLIIDTESAWYEALVEVFTAYGVQLPFELWVQSVGTSQDVFDPYIYFQQRYSEEIDIEEVIEKVNQQHSVIMSDKTLRPGVVSYMEEAKQLGYKIGIASSSHLSWIEPFLHKYDIAKYIDTIRCADFVEKVKPDPAVYLLTLEELGLEPDEAIAFEDSPNGAKAATRAGIKVVIVPNPVTERLEFGPHLLLLQSMADLKLIGVVNKCNLI